MTPPTTSPLLPPAAPPEPKGPIFAGRKKPKIDLAVVCSDSSVDVASMARLLRFQMAQALGKERTGRHYKLCNTAVAFKELERTKRYITELERAKAVRAGAPLHEEHDDRANEEEGGTGKGKKKGTNAGKRAGAARKAQQQAEEDLVAMSPEHVKELEEERQRLIDTYLKTHEFASFEPNAVAEFDGTTEMLFLYELLGQEEVLTPREDGSIGDVYDTFWGTIEKVVPADVEELAVVWAVSDPRLLRALKEGPADPSSAEKVPRERHAQLRLLLYANDGQFVDPTLAAPNQGDSAKRSSRFSMAKKSGGRKAGSQGSDGSRGSSRNKGGKGGPKGGAATPSDSAPPNFFEPGVDVDAILYDCQTFADFIEKQNVLKKQKAEMDKALDGTKPPNSECDPHLRIMVTQEEPLGARLNAGALADMPTPFEAHLNRQMALLPGPSAVGQAGARSATSGVEMPTLSVTPRSAASPSHQSTVQAEQPGAPAPPPEPMWAIIRTNQMGHPSDDDWINVCRRKAVAPLYELASIVSIYSHWRAHKKATDLPPPLKAEWARRQAPNFTQGARDAFRPFQLRLEHLKVFTSGLSGDELRARNGPLSDGGIQVYEREKLLGGEFMPYTALMALISQATTNLIRAQPLRLVQLDKPEALPPALSAVCQLDDAGAGAARRLFRPDSREVRARIGDNRGTASVAVAEKAAAPPVEEAEAKKDNSPAPPAKGKDAKKPAAKRPGNVKHEVKDEVAEKPPPDPPQPTAWVYPLEHCHREVEAADPSPQEVEWLVRQYVRKGLGAFFYAKRGCSVSPASAKLAVRGNAGKAQPVKSEVLQAVQRMQEFHSSRVGGRLLPHAESTNQRISLFRACYSFLKHLNRPSLVAALRDPRAAPVTHSAEMVSDGPLWDKVPQDLVVRLARQLTSEEENLKLAVERNLTARERAHVIQRTLLVEVARSVELLPPRTQILDETPLNIEEVLSLPTALYRLAQFPLRFGEHIASVYGFAAKEGDADPAAVEAGEAYAAKHSKNAENVYPARREAQFWVAGVPIPPRRRRSLIWVYPVSGCLPIDQFVAWKRWQSRNTVEREDGASPSGVGPVTFTAFSAPDDQAEAPHSPRKHGKLASEFMDQLLAKVLEYPNLHTSSQALPAPAAPAGGKAPSEPPAEMDNTMGPSENKIPLEELRSFRPGQDLYLAAEGRQALYPFCDAVVEIVTTNYSRQCRFLCASEVTATLHYNIPPPITDEDVSELMQILGRSSSSPEEAAYLTVRFDDGLTVTIANRAKPPVRLPQRQLSKTSRTGDERAASVVSLVKDTESILSFSSRGKGHSKDVKKKRDRRSHKRHSRNSMVELEKPPEAGLVEAPPQRPQPPLCPPIAPNGDVRLWTARGELPPDPAVMENAGSVPFGSRTNSDQLGQKVFEEPVKGLEPRELRVEPLDITITSSNFTFHNREGDGVLWFSYSLSSNPATPHHLSLPETVYCVHCNEGATSKLQASLEREVRRSVDETSGIVTRYFESGMTQTLFPDGAVRHRCREVGADAPTRSFILQESTPSRYCETLTLTSGVMYVRSVYSNSMAFLGQAESKENVADSFLRLNVFRDQHITYDPTNHAHTMSRQDGVSIVYYYARGTLLGPSARASPDGAGRTIDPLGQPGDSGWGDEDFRPDSTVSTATPLPRALNEQLRRMDTWDGTLTSADMTHGISMSDLPEVYARVALHADGTSITTFGDHVDGFEGTETCVGSSSQTPSPDATPNLGVAASIASLFNDARVVHAACQGPAKWCVESPRIPRIFLISVPDRLQQLNHTLQEWHLSFNRSGPFGMGETGQSMPFSAYDSFYLVFGDGSVLKRHLLSRPARGTIVPFLETVISRPSDTAVRIIHDNGLAVVERSVDVKRNFENAAAAAIGEGFGVFDLALGGFRLVDYLSHVTEVRDMYSPFGVSTDISPVSWETLLKQLVHSTYSSHRLPKAQMEKMAAQKEQEEEGERRKRADGVCPQLIDRMRELAEEFVISNGLLKPDVLHTLEKASRISKGLERVDFQKAFTESQTPHTGVLSTMMGQIHPVFLCQRANAEVVQFISEQAMEKIVEQEGLAELSPDPIYLLRSTAAGEPGVQQLSLFRIGVSGKPAPPTYGSTTAALLAGGREHHFPKSVGAPVTEPGSLHDTVEMRHKLSAFYNGMSFAAHYHHADNPAYDTTIADPAKYLGSFSRWLPRELQPPRRFLRPPARCDKGRSGVVELEEEDQQWINRSSQDGVRTFLQFQPVSASATNTVLNAELQRHRQLSDLSQYHQVMQNAFPDVPQEAIDEQKRLQQLYFAMRAGSRSANQTPVL